MKSPLNSVCVGYIKKMEMRLKKDEIVDQTGQKF